MSFNLMQSLSELPLKWKWHIVHFEAADNACPETEYPGMAVAITLSRPHKTLYTTQQNSVHFFSPV